MKSDFPEHARGHAHDALRPPCKAAPASVLAQLRSRLYKCEPACVCGSFRRMVPIGGVENFSNPGDHPPRASIFDAFSGSKPIANITPRDKPERQRTKRTSSARPTALFSGRSAESRAPWKRQSPMQDRLLHAVRRPRVGGSPWRERSDEEALRHGFSRQAEGAVRASAHSRAAHGRARSALRGGGLRERRARRRAVGSARRAEKESRGERRRGRSADRCTAHRSKITRPARFHARDLGG